jgi:hypothetical protein
MNRSTDVLTVELVDRILRCAVIGRRGHLSREHGGEQPDRPSVAEHGRICPDLHSCTSYQLINERLFDIRAGSGWGARGFATGAATHRLGLAEPGKQCDGTWLPDLPSTRRPTFRPVTTSTWVVLAVAALLLWVGGTLLEAWLGRRRRPSLSDRLTPYQASSVADEAEACLRSGSWAALPAKRLIGGSSPRRAGRGGGCWLVRRRG